MLVLREYQQRSLDALEAYLRLTARQGAKLAFLHETERPYHSVPASPMYTAESAQQSPTVRIEYEQAVAIGGIGETLAATKSKHWGEGRSSGRSIRRMNSSRTESRTCTGRTACITGVSSNAAG